MKAAVLTELHQPFALKDMTDPQPGPGQVRIRMQATGLCGTDIHVWKGSFPVPLPMVLGHEPVGVVDQLGAGVTKLQVGDRVGVSWTQGGCGRCHHCQKKRELYCEQSICWIQNGGGNSELMIAEAEGCTLLPEGLSWEHAAPLFCAGFTIMSGYRNAKPQTGERVAILGMGGLGHLALQMAKAMGHEVIAVTGTENKRSELTKLGADEVVVVKDHAGKELKAIGGTDIVLSCSNSMRHNSEIIDGIRPDGRLVTMALSDDMLQVPPFTPLIGQINIIGSIQNHRADLVEILELAAAEKVTPKLEIYPLQKINTALTRLAEGQVRYRAVMIHEE
jgi:D-arabinose 1-dehydrogenase-like Zn-dependent alcohol dehydrogenase